MANRFKCGLPVSKIFLRSIFNFNFKLFEVALSVGGEDKSKKIFMRPEKESTLSFYEIWTLSRLHTSRFR
jgi:hypothetical protein